MAKKKDRYIVGLDIGTHKICAIVAEITDEGRLDVIGIGQTESKGLRKGVVINLEATVESIKRVVEATKVSGEVVRIKNPQGDIIGLGSHFRANPEVFAYRIGKLMAIVQGPPGEVIPFFQKLP